MANSPHPSGRLQQAAFTPSARNRLQSAPSSGLVNPVPNGVRGRIDQGVDWSNIRGNIVAVGQGVITKVYPSLQGFATTVIEKLSTPSGGYDYVYYGLESGGGTPVVHEGEKVTAGQAIAPGLGTGGIEVGYWNPSTGASEGAPGFSESDPSTAAGRQFSAALTGKVRPGGETAGGSGAGGGGSGGGGGDVSQLFSNYLSLRDMPRVAPPSTKNPFMWWLASFTGNWDNLTSDTGASTQDTTSQPASGKRGHDVVTASFYNAHGTGAGGLVSDVQSVPGFAELNMGHALGDLPFGTKINVTYKGRTITIPKLDIGAGGGGLTGHTRAIDLTMPAARELHFPLSAGLANVTWTVAN